LEIEQIESIFGLIHYKVLFLSQYIASFGKTRTSNQGLSKIFLDICTTCLWRCDKNFRVHTLHNIYTTRGAPQWFVYNFFARAIPTKHLSIFTKSCK